MLRTERVSWNCRSWLEKYRDILELGKEDEFYATHKPYEVINMEGNALSNAGIDLIWDLVDGTSGVHFNNANSVLEVYIVDTWTAGTLDGSYPTSASQKISFKASWAGATGDGVWSKWRVTNGATAMNEKTEALGTKSGGTWTLTVSITLS